MALRIHDTLRREVVELTPRDPGRWSIYVCGPTVYDVPHLGHARTALVFDVLRRYLTWRGSEVTHVSNVTDVDDKIIERAAAEGSTEPEIARRYEDVYWEQIGRLGVLRPEAAPHATDAIDRMIDLVARLVEVGAAYAVEGQGVYFDVDSSDDYGALPHRSPEDLLEGAGARVEVDERKRSPLDFALWKAAKPGEPSWDSPWGSGRPGWHIECSAMSLELLGDGFDLHGGGNDLVFPHHENERVQAEAAGHPFARHWMHSGMVVVEGEKMSKSLGNFTTLGDVLDRYDPRVLRLLVLQTHYRKPMEMGARNLDSAAAAVEGLAALARRAEAAGVTWEGVAPDDDALGAFRTAMDDDLGTPNALGIAFEQVTRANQAIDHGDSGGAATSLATAAELFGALGLELTAGGSRRAAGATDDTEIDALVAARDRARADRDFAEADRIREALAERGVKLEDTPTGTIWRR